MKKVYVNFTITILVVLAMVTSIFYLMSNSLFTVDWFSTNYLNRVFSYQATTLVMALVIVFITALQTGFKSLKLLSIRNIDGEVIPEPLIGLKNKNNDSWKTVGAVFTFTISAITAIAIYFQIYRNGVVIANLRTDRAVCSE